MWLGLAKSLLWLVVWQKAKGKSELLQHPAGQRSLVEPTISPFRKLLVWVES